MGYNPSNSHAKAQSQNSSWIAWDSPYSEYINDLCTIDPRLRQPHSKPLKFGISWENRAVKGRIIEFGDVGTQNMSISPVPGPDFLANYLSQQRGNSTPHRTVYIFEGMNKDVATILGNHFWLDPAIFMEYQRTYSTASKRNTSHGVLATSLATHSFLYLPYRDLVTLPNELVGYFSLGCVDTARAISTTRINGEFDTLALANRKCLVWNEMTDSGWNCIVICDLPLRHVEIRDEGPYKGHRFPASTKSLGGGYVNFLPTSVQTQRRQGSHGVSLADDLCFYLEHYSTLPGLTLENPDVVAFFAKKIIASLYNRTLDHLLAHIIRPHLPTRRQYDFTELDLAAVEANWSSCQSLEKRLHQYCYDLEYILTQLKIPLQNPDPSQITSWQDVHIDFQMLHHQFQYARNWIGKINASLTGLSGIAGNRQAFREQQLSLEAADRTRNITTLGLVFVPLAYIASLFSMSDQFAPGGAKFWLYFAIAIPVTLAMLAVYQGMDWIRKHNANRKT